MTPMSIRDIGGTVMFWERKNPINNYAIHSMG